MDRRDFMKTSSTLLAGAEVRGQLFAKDQNSGGRMVLAMNRGWRYSSKAVDGGHEATFDDSGVDHVVVPHTNIKLPWHGFDDKEYEFVSLYRRKFRLPQPLEPCRSIFEESDCRDERFHFNCLS
jgi:beta-galactosidase